MKNKYIKSTLEQLNKSQAEAKPYRVNVLGKDFIVYPNVFSPKYFQDTSFFAKNIPYQSEEKFLEIGSGTGIIAVIAALNGSIVTAIDINKFAIENTEANAKLHHVKLRILQSDLYSSLEKSDKFDTIFWNVPFIYTEKEEFTDLEKSVFNPRYILIKKFLIEGKNHLLKDGRVLIGFSKSIGNYKLLKQIVKDSGFLFKEIVKTNIDYGKPIGKISLEIYEAKLK